MARDTFDVDEALREVESSGGSSTKPSRDTKSSLTRQIQQHTLDVEAFLTELDEVCTCVKRSLSTFHVRDSPYLLMCRSEAMKLQRVNGSAKCQRCRH